MKQLITVYVLVLIFGIPWFVFNYPQATRNIMSYIDSAINQVASVIVTHNPKSAEVLKSKYNDSKNNMKIKILVVPGHEPDFGGAEYGDIKERDLTVELSGYLAKYLRENRRFEVVLTRDSQKWLPPFDEYFSKNWDSIKEWYQAYKEENARFINMNQSSKYEAPVYHNSARQDVALRLHGINKWINENDVDIAIHIHFNDYPRSRLNSAGEYTGFSVYVPEKLFYNSSTTKAIADKVYNRLSKYNAVSDLNGEKKGIVEDRDLIAVGSNNTLNSASMLIEYGYIYEPQFNNSETKDMALKDLAYQTYLGLIDFFDPEMSAYNSLSYDTTILPYYWNKPVDQFGAKDTFALQTAFMYDSIYPPRGYSKNDCPRTGKIGPCTKSAIQTFSDKFSKNKSLSEVLNTRYGAKMVN